MILDRGGHGPGVIIKDNPGELYQPKLAHPRKTAQRSDEQP